MITFEFFLFLLITAIILLYFHVTRNFNYWKNRNVPYVKPIPLFGNVFKVCTLQQNIGQFTCDLYRRTRSPYFGFFVFDQPFLLIREPELIKSFLVKDFDYFDDRSIAENRRDDEMGSNILFVIKNPDWRNLRMKLSPVFSTGKLKSMIALMIESSKDLIDYLNEVAVNEKSTDARDVCMKHTTNVIASCAFGINAESFKYEDVGFRFVSKRIFHWSFSRAIQMASYYFAPFLVKLFRMKFLDPPSAKFMKEAFTKTISERERSGTHRGDLIDILIQLKKDSDSTDNYKLDGEKLVAQAANFFFAGYESSGSAISFTLYELCINPCIQERLRTEMETVVNKYGQITYESLQEMKYLDMVVNETLRKYPVLPFVDRRCTKTYMIPGTDITIDKGIPIYISLLGLHYDPEYFPDPEKYDPERFSYEGKKTRPTCAYLPFGEGLHNCIGARFGIISTKIGLIRILSNFEVELSEDSPVPLKFDCKGILLAPVNGIRMHFKHHHESIK